MKFDPHRGDTPSRIIGDLNLAGWAAVMADLIRDVAVLARGTYKAPELVTEGPEVKYPDGLDIVISWAGNDVYGPYGYLGCFCNWGACP